MKSRADFPPLRGSRSESVIDYRAIFDALGDAVFILDAETAQILDANQKMHQMYGYTVDELTQMKWGDISAGLFPYMGEEANRRIVSAAREAPQLFEWMEKNSAGDFFWVEVSVNLAADGNERYIIATTRDITDRKRVEQELTATKDYLNTVFNSIHDAVFIHDANGRVVDVNDKMLDMYKLTRQEAKALSIIPDYTTPEGRPDLSAIWKRVMRGQDEVLECRGRRPKDGFEFDVEVFLTKLPLPEADYILATVRNISERKRVDRELTAVKDYLNTVFNSIHDAVFVHDVNGRVVDVNDKLLNMYRLTREEAIGLSIIPDYTTPEGRPDLHGLWRRVMEGQNAFVQCRGRRPKDGYEFDAETFVTRLSLPGGDYILAMTRDISERKTIERQLTTERETFFSVLEDNPHGIALIDASDHYVYVNPKFTNLTGYSLPDIPTWSEWIRKIDAEAQSLASALDAHRRQDSSKGEGREVESRIRCKSGEYKDIECRITRLEDKCLIVLTDLTAWKSAERSLQAEKQKFQRLSESSPVGMVVIDTTREFKFKYLNPKFKELFGCDLKDTTDIYTWLARIYPNPASRNRTTSKWIDVLETIKTGASHSFVRKLDGKKDSEKYIRFVPVQLQTGEILLTCWDITKNREAEQRITERNLVLEVLNKVMTSVTGSLDLSKILQALKRVIVEKLKIGVGGVFFYSEIDGRITTQMCWGVPASNRDAFAGYALQCFSKGEVIHKNDIALVRYRPGRGDAVQSRKFVKYRVRSCLAISFLEKEETQVIVFLADRRHDAFSDDQIAFYKALGQQISVATENARLFQEVRQSHADMKALSLRLVRVQEEELRHVGRELHDEIGQLLTGLGLALQADVQPTGEPSSGLVKARSLANTITGLVRELSRKLRPSMLDDLGLLPTLPWLFERFSTHTNVRVAFEHMQVDNKRFSHEVETAVYRIVQEALTNVARHAKVDSATVRLWSNERIVGVQIEDKGIGFDYSSALNGRNTNGLYGMRERVMLLGGRFTVETNVEDGTRLTAELPIARENAQP